MCAIRRNGGRRKGRLKGSSQGRGRGGEAKGGGGCCDRRGSVQGLVRQQEKKERVMKPAAGSKALFHRSEQAGEGLGEATKCDARGGLHGQLKCGSEKRLHATMQGAHAGVLWGERQVAMS